jgi:hypothetical protein
MDNSIITAGIVAVIAIIAVTLVLNPFETTDTTTAEETNGDTEAQETDTQDDTDSDIDDTDDTGTGTTDSGGYIPEDFNPDSDIKPHGTVQGEVKGNCTLYISTLPEDQKFPYKCFGVAGNISKPAPHYYRKTTSDEYFCKPTNTGCTVYEKVDFQWLQE